MALLVVRHAIAVEREQWSADDGLRPLTVAGRTQAQRLSAWLGAWPDPGELTPLISSPAERCIKTLQPFAARARRVIVERDELLSGCGADAARRLAAERLEQGGGVLCSHGEVIAPLLRALGVEPIDGRALDDCAKGSVWVLEPHGQRIAGRYVPPDALDGEHR
jgi:8-oxo-dGTP diphosphatase